MFSFPGMWDCHWPLPLPVWLCYYNVHVLNGHVTVCIIICPCIALILFNAYLSPVSMMWSHSLLHTVIWEIFVVKIFAWSAQTMKIYHMECFQ